MKASESVSAEGLPVDDLAERLNRWAENELQADAEREAIQSEPPLAVHSKPANGHDDSAQRERPEPIDWAKLQGKTPPPRVWWIQDWLTPAPTLCAGAGGSGKSLLWQTLGTALALGREFIGATTAPLRVLMWACEDDPDEIWRRQAAICAHFGIKIETLQGIMNVVPRLGCDNTLLDLTYGKPTFTPEYLLLREEVNDVKADVFVADNNRHIFGGNESDGHQVTMFVNGMNGMVRGRAFAPVLLGHTSRAAGSEFSGSAAWENACRMRLYLGPTLPDQKPEQDEPPDEDTMYLARRKANYTAKDWRRLKFVNGLWLP
jgi:RecA-family ATPase